MDIMEELMDATSKVDTELVEKRLKALTQHLLNTRAQAAIEGMADMKYMVEVQQKLEESEKKK